MKLSRAIGSRATEELETGEEMNEEVSDIRLRIDVIQRRIDILQRRIFVMIFIEGVCLGLIVGLLI